MPRLVTYDSLHNKMVFNLESGNINAILDNVSLADSLWPNGYLWGGNNPSWQCGTGSVDFDTAYFTMKPYAPLRANHQAESPIGGFTLCELLQRGYIAENSTKIFYLDNDLNNYITFSVGAKSTNSFGTEYYNPITISAHVNGVNLTWINNNYGNTVNCGLFFGTFNGVQGYYVFQITEVIVVGMRDRYETIYTQGNTAIPHAIYLMNFTPPSPINVDTSNEPIGAWDGDYEFTGDTIDLPSAPDETVSGVLASGFLNIYSPTASQLQSFGSALWTNAFNVKWYDIDSLANLVLNTISDPINFIIGLFMLPVTPTTGNASGIYLGGINVNTISCNRVTKQFVTLDFGSINISELYGNYLDYAYSRLSIYLPYIGMADIDVQEVTGGEVSLQYIIDCFTGACVANVKCVKNTETPWGSVYSNSTVHSYSGNVALQLPISAGSFDTMTQGLINVGLGLISGQPQTVAKGATDVIQSVGGDATTRGSLSSNTGKLSYQTPYLMFTRPIESRPANLGKLHGYGAGVGGVLKNFSGYVECSDVKLDGISATDNELSMIESLLKSGVYV